MEKDNKLIAEFMGEKFTDNSGVVQGLNYKLIEKKHGKGNNGFRFHTSWDWLIPVMKKIDSYAKEEMSFAEYDDYRNIYFFISDISLHNDISDVYNQVVQFIKNQNN